MSFKALGGLKGSLAFVQHINFVNSWFRFLMSRTGYTSRPDNHGSAAEWGSLHSPLNLQQVYPVRRSTATCRAQYRIRAQKNCNHKK